jgi:pyruvate/2-oxoglutarate dehydrogenase complex dihydrolipoamide dehydrogenase (E3) component
METRDYQAVIIGAGPGGYPAGIRLAQLGVKTLVTNANTGAACASTWAASRPRP